jgi:hypothetical protein
MKIEYAKARSRKTHNEDKIKTMIKINKDVYR